MILLLIPRFGNVVPNLLPMRKKQRNLPNNIDAKSSGGGRGGNVWNVRTSGFIKSKVIHASLLYGESLAFQLQCYFWFSIIPWF